MKINLREAVAQPIHHANHIVFGDVMRLMEPEQPDPSILMPRSAAIRRVRRESVRKIIASINFAATRSREIASVVNTGSAGIRRHGILYSCASVDHDIGDRGMHMKIEMAIDMVKVSDQL